MFRRAWWQSSSRILEGRQGARKKKKRKKKNLFFRDKWSGDTHLLAPHVWFALFLCFTLWFDEKNPLWHTRVPSIKLRKILGNYNGQTQTLWFDKKKIACSISHVKWQFVFCEIAMGTRKKSRVAMMFELRFFASDCDLTKIKSRKLQWADDGNEF